MFCPSSGAELEPDSRSAHMMVCEYCESVVVHDEKAARADPEKSIAIAVETRYLTGSILPGLFRFPADIDRAGMPVIRLNDPVVSSLSRHGYHKYLN